MLGRLLLLPEQCEPMDEFLAVVRQAQHELENPRAMEYYGRGEFANRVVDQHEYITEELLYPLIERCNPNQLDVVVTPYHIEVRLR